MFIFGKIPQVRIKAELNVDDLTPIWKALSDPTRRRILDLLSERPQTTGELCSAFGVSRFAVIKHLSILKEANLVLVRPRGRERWNYLNAAPLQRIYERWLRPYQAHWAASLVQLKHYAEETKGGPMAAKIVNLEAFREIHIEQEVTIAAPPERVFEALTRDIAVWWSAPFFHSTTARRLVLEPEVGGRFYEDLGDGQGLLLATVSFIKQPDQLRMVGPLGMSGLVQGVISFQLEAKDEGTLLKLSHRAIGEVTEETHSGYAAGWEVLLGTRLRAYVEQGVRYDIRK